MDIKTLEQVIAMEEDLRDKAKSLKDNLGFAIMAGDLAVSYQLILLGQISESLVRLEKKLCGVEVE